MAGRATYVQGKELENRLDFLHGQYEQNEWAKAHRNELTARYVGSHHTKLVVAPKALPDYTAFVAPLGRGVMFDAKSTSKVKYTHAADRRHQLETLYWFGQFGVVAFLLVVAGKPGEEAGYLLWPQESWQRREPYTVHLDELDDDPYDITGCQCPAWYHGEQDVKYIPDWLSIVRQRFKLDID